MSLESKCEFCDGKGNSWLVTYQDEKVVQNFFGDGKHLEKGKTLNKNTYDMLCFNYRKNKIFSKPHILEIWNKLKEENNRNIELFRASVNSYDLRLDRHSLKSKDEYNLAPDEAIKRYGNKLTILSLFEISKHISREESHTELANISEQYLLCNRCETGKNKLANKKSVNAF